MLWHGHRASIRALVQESWTACCWESPKDGRCEHGLAAAAATRGFRLEHVYATTEAETYEEFRRQLLRAPVLTCVDHFNHWVTVVKATTRHVWLIDSERGGQLHQRAPWRPFLRRLTYGLSDEVTFHLYPVLGPGVVD